MATLTLNLLRDCQAVFQKQQHPLQSHQQCKKTLDPPQFYQSSLLYLSQCEVVSHCGDLLFKIQYYGSKIHLCCHMQLFIHFTVVHFLVLIYHNLLAHCSIDGQLGCLQFFTFINRIFLYKSTSFSREYVCISKWNCSSVGYIILKLTR